MPMMSADSEPVAGSSAPRGHLDRRLMISARVLAIVLVLVACLRLAWVGDDALITLRTALNLSHGWGPGFNATEAVQAYTHPLWFLLWIGLGAATSQWILGMLALSLAFTGLAVGLLVHRTSSIGRLILVTGLLILSNAFIEYATSGLENPLGYATVGLLLAMTMGPGPKAGRAGLWWAIALGLTAAAVILTRFDLVLLIAPVMLLLVVEHRHRWQLVVTGLVTAMVPLAVWLLWSEATYASWLPNTFLAKRNVDIPAMEMIVQGLRYLWVTFEHDPVSLVALTMGVGLALAVGRRFERAWVVGMLTYLAYVIWVGGDFMAGRFLAIPVYVAVFLLGVARLHSTTATTASESGTALNPAPIAAASAVIVLLLAGSAAAGSIPVALANTQTPRWEVDTNFNAGVGDERGVYSAQAHTLKSLIDNLALAYVNPDIVPVGDGTGLSRTLREINKAAQNWPTTDTYIGTPSEVAEFCGLLGSIGIATGPRTHLIDNCALTDRFLASKPSVARDFAWKPGHFHRQVPEGYADALRMNDPDLLTDPAERFYLARLWEEIRPQQPADP